jgi:hypothetical protein
MRKRDPDKLEKEIAERRKDKPFMLRLRRRMKEDRDALRRLAR